MTYYFDVAVQAHIRGELEADSEEEAREKILQDLLLLPQMNEAECECEWEIKYPCHGHVCNFFGGGIELVCEDAPTQTI